MKTAIVISDTHGNIKDLEKMTPLFEENDYVFHVGDGIDDLNKLPERLKEKFIIVCGNCDKQTEPSERVVEIEGVKIFMTHGHNYGAKGSPLRLLLRAKELGASVCFYGHSHRATIETEDGVTLINPGNLTRYSIEKSFAYCVFSNGKITACINKNFFL